MRRSNQQPKVCREKLKVLGARHAPAFSLLLEDFFGINADAVEGLPVLQRALVAPRASSLPEEELTLEALLWQSRAELMEGLAMGMCKVAGNKLVGVSAMEKVGRTNELGTACVVLPDRGG